MKRTAKAMVAAAVMVPLSATAALAATIPGGPYGDALYGTPYADTIYGYGGADAIYGYGGNDLLYGGNEVGSGDLVVGGIGDDRVFGNNGEDALYGEAGNDRLYGGYHDDLVQGGWGLDTMSGGPGADRINAQEGQKDTINVCGSSYGDVVYYDRGLDVFVGCVSASKGSAAMSAEEAIKAGKVKLVAQKPPKGLFERTGKVVVEHEGKELVIAEKDLKTHAKHGDKVLDPTGRAAAEEGRR